MTDETPITSEALSALVDGESNDLDCQRVLKAVKEDESYRETWRRYHMARAVMRNDARGETLFLDISSQVRSAIEAEDGSALLESEAGDQAVKSKAWLDSSTTNSSDEGGFDEAGAEASSGKQWQWLSGKVAIAASVALVFVLGTQQLNVAGGSDSNLAQGQMAALPAVTGSSPQLYDHRSRSVSTGSASSRTRQASYAGIQPEADQLRYMREAQLQEYISRLAVQHAEQSSFVNGLKAVPYARVGHAINTPSTGAANPNRQDAKRAK